LWPENVEAWAVFQRVAARFVVDAGLAGDVFRRLTTDRDDAEAVDLVERLGVIYDLVCPAKKQD
jgi:hypothetical protein